ncbi:hypothetical protein [Actinomadura nitritigenes]|uniref:hypothetical protein n=1 Tax=Actinomadura nitritigenes TaxID=134602 RepID=UPI003D8C2B9A
MNEFAIPPLSPTPAAPTRPDRTIAFVRAQDRGSLDFWMNSVWWRAVLLLDLRHRRMLVQIADDVCAPSVPEIRAWLRTVRGVWPGWDVRWAPRGLHEVMDYLGLPYDTVRYLDDPPPPLAGQWASPPNGDDPTEMPETLIAVRDGQGRLSLAPPSPGRR